MSSSLNYDALNFKLIFFTILLINATALTNQNQNPKSNSTQTQINSNSVLVALLDSHYTELSELVEKALLLQTLEQAVSQHNITIFAPNNEALERHMDPEFKRFLLEPGNLKSLQKLLLFHIIPTRVGSEQWPGQDTGSVAVAHHKTLCVEESENRLPLTRGNSGEKIVGGLAKVTRPDDVTRPDGLIHGIERLLVPRSVQEEFNRRRSLTSISAVLPEGAPVVDPRTHRLKKPAPVPAGAPPVLPIYDAMAPGPSLAPAPAPGPGGPRHHFDGESQVKDFIQTLLHYGGYNELADILVNLTSLATEMGRLVSEGYVLTVLAPNDEAMAKLTTDQLSDPGAPEQIMYYHLIPEYQTEESMYNSVRRFGKVQYDTLRLPHKVVAEEADGSVKFGSGEGSAYLFDPDIYTDGRISVQGIDGVLFPVEETKEKPASKVSPATATKVVANQRRGKLLEVACSMAGVFGHFTSCN
ncbi:putative FAS1 domain-containing protein [Helianthus annuus]|uniref:FAS1 domain-containing protein n=1 Tax=Helianthus annuus TaxID=4232 RepID=A0A251SLI2_HELAN|nr:fasciclin-like arabinogalactan protein 15 [Helianthus annuus]KAF5770272.1 putative FAS1 domain-containing protein [Helianthus annuus]KAJ0465205.1 putative fasciclin-like arabinogalactan protein/17/18 [Helianthus annuus]KAJ0486797.1 putative fasciclin-like arabinogalactan protein/17/18 [Helianthus annuus]KAJ0660934.1 putative fasciclin-like arabinogalactan protein/17/18 [Helianthus annuus]KAJ0854989.1 putative FAS1 domain-containing protein [Helianthus annuus]